MTWKYILSLQDKIKEYLCNSLHDTTWQLGQVSIKTLEIIVSPDMKIMSNVFFMGQSLRVNVLDANSVFK